MKVGLTGKARALRRGETEEETILWRHLRNRQIDDWKFRRQVPRGAYVVDFLCVEAGLAIEVDGSQHRTFGAMRDKARTRDLQQHGVRVLRFGNEDILGNLDGVLDEIYNALGGKEAPSPGALRLGATRRPLPKGRGGTEASRPPIENHKIDPDAQSSPSPLEERVRVRGLLLPRSEETRLRHDGEVSRVREVGKCN